MTRKKFNDRRIYSKGDRVIITDHDVMLLHGRQFDIRGEVVQFKVDSEITYRVQLPSLDGSGYKRITLPPNYFELDVDYYRDARLDQLLGGD